MILKPVIPACAGIGPTHSNIVPVNCGLDAENRLIRLQVGISACGASVSEIVGFSVAVRVRTRTDIRRKRILVIINTIQIYIRIYTFIITAHNRTLGSTFRINHLNRDAINVVLGWPQTRNVVYNPFPGHQQIIGRSQQLRLGGLRISDRHCSVLIRRIDITPSDIEPGEIRLTRIGPTDENIILAH